MCIAKKLGLSLQNSAHHILIVHFAIKNLMDLQIGSLFLELLLFLDPLEGGLHLKRFIVHANAIRWRKLLNLGLDFLVGTLPNNYESRGVLQLDINLPDLNVDSDLTLILLFFVVLTGVLRDHYYRMISLFVIN